MATTHQRPAALAHTVRRLRAVHARRLYDVGRGLRGTRCSRARPSSPARPRRRPAHLHVVRLALQQVVRREGEGDQQEAVEEGERHRVVRGQRVNEEFGQTEGPFVADKETYGVGKQWCVLKGIPIRVDSDDDSESPLEVSESD